MDANLDCGRSVPKSLLLLHNKYELVKTSAQFRASELSHEKLADLLMDLGLQWEELRQTIVKWNEQEKYEFIEHILTKTDASATLHNPLSLAVISARTTMADRVRGAVVHERWFWVPFFCVTLIAPIDETSLCSITESVFEHLQRSAVHSNSHPSSEHVLAVPSKGVVGSAVGLFVGRPGFAVGMFVGWTGSACVGAGVVGSMEPPVVFQFITDLGMNFTIMSRIRDTCPGEKLSMQLSSL